MSLIQFRFFSECLNMCTVANIILPMPRNAALPVEDLPVLYLLHGMGDNESAWIRKTNIERYALEKGLAVVMPDGALSCYENMAQGVRYRDFICEELPGIIRANFPVSKKREKNFIAGCSMGGFGALKLALSNPEKWSIVGCLSAAHFEYRPDSPRNRDMLSRVYCDQIDAYDARIAADAANMNAGKTSLRIWHSCGDRDALRENALITRAFFENMEPGSIEYSFEMLPGKHDWALWDESIRRFLPALELPEPEVHLF